MQVGVDARMLSSSGIGKVIENILKRMIPKRPEWQFFLIINRKDCDKFSFLSLPNVSCIECDASIYSIKEQFELWNKIPKHLDVFWSPHYNIPLLYTGKLVVTVHDLAHLALRQDKHDFLKKMYARFMMKNVLRKATKIVCVSQFTIDELKRFFPEADTSKLSLIYNSVDESWHNIKPGKQIRNRPYYIFVGNVKPHKNLARLIEAYKFVCSEVRQDLVIVGKKDGFINGLNNISELIKGYEDRIVFTGYVDDDTLKQYVVQSDGMIFPSLYEGFGLPPLEALAAGIPVMCSDIPVLREIYKDKVTYFNPYRVDDIQKCLKNEKRWFGSLNMKWDEPVKKMIDVLYKESCKE